MMSYKCPKQIKLPISLYKCAPNSYLPTNTSTMMYNILIDACRTDYLLNVLKSDDPSIQADGFKADIHKKWNEKSEEQKRKELVRFVFLSLSLCLFRSLSLSLFTFLATRHTLKKVDRKVR